MILLMLLILRFLPPYRQAISHRDFKRPPLPYRHDIPHFRRCKRVTWYYWGQKIYEDDRWWCWLLDAVWWWYRYYLNLDSFIIATEESSSRHYYRAPFKARCTNFTPGPYITNKLPRLSVHLWHKCLSRADKPVIFSFSPAKVISKFPHYLYFWYEWASRAFLALVAH